ncbi:MAG: hypothetical protein IPP88_21145 [Betaproteobacteria bacterium]|nr:hypothetical protein [Betaproteobacteria bacterium]
MKRFVRLFGLFLFIHFLATWICFTKSVVIKPQPNTHAWRQAAEILAIPFVYLEPSSDSDFLLVLMIGNSILWATLLATFVVLALHFGGRKR